MAALDELTIDEIKERLETRGVTVRRRSSAAASSNIAYCSSPQRPRRRSVPPNIADCSCADAVRAGSADVAERGGHARQEGRQDARQGQRGAQRCTVCARNRYCRCPTL